MCGNLEKILDSITDITIDSREVKNGSLFLAMKGERVDGHDYVPQAIKNGAKYVVVEHEIKNIDGDRQILVESSRKTLDALARCNISRRNAKIIAVTGSVGKTTTRNLIHHLIGSIEGNEQTYVSRKNFNSKIGLPISVAMMPASARFGVFEMGMSAAGDIKHLVDIVPPSVSVITHICEAHLQYFNSIWDIAKAKSEIFETEIPQEYAVIPGNSAYTEILKDKAKKCGVKHILTFGIGDAEVIATKYDGDTVHIVANIFGKHFEYSINFENIDDSLAAILAVQTMTSSLEQLKDGLSSFRKLDNRGGKYIIKDRNIEIIDDTYNACPTSLKSAIRAMSRRVGRKILVVGDMLELGIDAIHMHANISATVDKYGVDKVFACGELSRHLFDNLQQNKRGAWAQNSQDIAEQVFREMQDNDCILIKGSRAMKMDFIVNYLIENKVK